MFGDVLRFLTAGESHGPALSAILDGIPAGVALERQGLIDDLARRQRGYGRSGRQKIEDDGDSCEIIGGLRFGITLGSPLAFLLRNRDHVRWTEKMSVWPLAPEITPPDPVVACRPGHADLAAARKYDFDDIRNSLERASARETAMRVAVGAICRQFLRQAAGIEVVSHVIAVGQIATPWHSIPAGEAIGVYTAQEIRTLSDATSLRTLPTKESTDDTEKKCEEEIQRAQKQGDSLGGIFEVIATGLPMGLGSYRQADTRLSAKISASIGSIHAVKGVEIGMGFQAGRTFGSHVHDEISPDAQKVTRRHSNSAGGVEGGISNAQPIVIRAVMKPIPTLPRPLESVDVQTGQSLVAHRERADTCAVAAAAAVAEAMLCFTLADALLLKFGGDSLAQVRAHLQASARYG